MSNFRRIDMAQLAKALNKDLPQAVPVYRFSNGREFLQNINNIYDSSSVYLSFGEQRITIGGSKLYFSEE